MKQTSLMKNWKNLQVATLRSSFPKSHRDLPKGLKTERGREKTMTRSTSSMRISPPVVCVAVGHTLPVRFFSPIFHPPPFSFPFSKIERGKKYTFCLDFLSALSYFIFDLNVFIPFWDMNVYILMRTFTCFHRPSGSETGRHRRRPSACYSMLQD